MAAGSVKVVGLQILPGVMDLHRSVTKVLCLGARLVRDAVSNPTGFRLEQVEIVAVYYPTAEHFGTDTGNGVD